MYIHISVKLQVDADLKGINKTLINKTLITLVCISGDFDTFIIIASQINLNL